MWRVHFYSHIQAALSSVSYLHGTEAALGVESYSTAQENPYFYATYGFIITRNVNSNSNLFSKNPS